jgi:hypothetical protein
MRVLRRILLVLTWLALLPASAYAQTSITGTVKDASGAILPGVTVEASSDALIEKVRTTITDGSGQYTVHEGERADRLLTTLGEADARRLYEPQRTQRKTHEYDWVLGCRGDASACGAAGFARHPPPMRVARRFRASWFLLLG